MKAFREIFLGREDVWGAEHGSCVRSPIDQELWDWHLASGSIGVYPLVDGKVHWGCTDIDLGYETSWPLARNLRAVLRELGIHSTIERTKSKGFHVWVHLVDGLWIEAEVMRNTLLVAHQVAGVPPTEVNPKQLTGEFGNYVNLPYAAPWVELGRRVACDDKGEAVELEDFLDIVEDRKNEAESLLVAATLYVPTMKPTMLDSSSWEGDNRWLVKKMNALCWTIFDEGPLDGSDRSGTILRFACLCAESGLQPEEVHALIVDIDGRWGKGWMTRTAGKGESIIQDIVNRAFRTK